MRPCAAELARFGALLAAGAVPIGRFAEQVQFFVHLPQPPAV